MDELKPGLKLYFNFYNTERRVASLKKQHENFLCGIILHFTRKGQSFLPQL